MIAQSPTEYTNQIHPTPTYVFRPENIPASLSAVPRWCNYYTEPKPDGRTNKLPCNASGFKIDVASEYAAPNFRTFDAVTEALARNPRLDGIGYIFTDDDDNTGIDIDHCVDDDGNISPEAQAIIDALDSYSELSLSEHGIHIIARGDISANVKGDGVEMYTRGRFFTMSGRHIDGTPDKPLRRPRQLTALYERLKPTPTEPKPKAEPKPAPTEPSTTRETSAWTDAELVEKATNGKNGAVFARLWNGDTSKHGGDHSRADLDLLGKLLFWTNGDGYRADAMFRQSGLLRDKWDERHYENGETYGAHTRGVALASFDGNGYTGGRVYSGRIEDDASAPTDARIEQLLALVAELRATIARQEIELVSLRRLVLQNLALQQKPDKRERDSVLAALAEVESAKSRGQVDERGFSRLSLGEVARCAGFSRPTVSAHLRMAAASGLCEVETRAEGFRVVNRETGEITYLPAIFARFGDADATRAAICDWQPERKPIGRPVGRRCSEHPTADVLLDKRWTCAVCHKVIAVETTVLPYTEPDEETEATEPDSNQESEAVKYFTTPPSSRGTTRNTPRVFPLSSCGTTMVRSNTIRSDTRRINLTESHSCACEGTATIQTNGVWHCGAHPPSGLRRRAEQVAFVAVSE